eukprot:Opistho-2@57539
MDTQAITRFSQCSLLTLSIMVAIASCQNGRPFSIALMESHFAMRLNVISCRAVHTLLYQRRDLLDILKGLMWCTSTTRTSHFPSDFERTERMHNLSTTVTTAATSTRPTITPANAVLNLWSSARRHGCCTDSFGIMRAKMGVLLNHQCLSSLFLMQLWKGLPFFASTSHEHSAAFSSALAISIATSTVETLPPSPADLALRDALSWRMVVQDPLLHTVDLGRKIASREHQMRLMAALREGARDMTSSRVPHWLAD